MRKTLLFDGFVVNGRERGWIVFWFGNCGEFGDRVGCWDIWSGLCGQGLCDEIIDDFGVDGGFCGWF